jgi:hypothetical protein
MRRALLHKCYLPDKGSQFKGWRIAHLAAELVITGGVHQ